MSENFLFIQIEVTTPIPNAVLNRLRPRMRSKTHNSFVNYKETVLALPSDTSTPDENELNEIFRKISANGPINPNVLMHEGFVNLIQATRSVLPKLTLSQMVDVLRQIIVAKIPMDDELCDLVIDALLSRISMISVDEIIEIDFLLRKSWGIHSLNSLFDTLRLTMRTLFAIKVNEELNDELSYEKLLMIVRYLSNNTCISKTIGLDRLAQSLLLIDDNNFQLNDIVCVIITLARCASLDEHSKQLISKMYRIWCNKASTTDHVDNLLSLLVQKKRKFIDMKPFNDAQFIQHCTKVMVDSSDWKKSFEIQEKFNEMVTLMEIYFFLQFFDYFSIFLFRTS